MAKEMTAPHCVQCGQEMLYGTDGGSRVPVCSNLKCLTFGLLQMGIEQMAKTVDMEYDEEYVQSLRQKVKRSDTWAGIDAQEFLDEVRTVV